MWVTGVRNYGRIHKVRKKFINEINDDVKSDNNIWPDIDLQTTDNTFDHYLKEDVPSEQDIVCLYYINDPQGIPTFT